MTTHYPPPFYTTNPPNPEQSKKRKNDVLEVADIASALANMSGPPTAADLPPSKRQKTDLDRTLYDKAKESSDIAVLHVKLSSHPNQGEVTQLATLEKEFLVGIGVQSKQQRYVQ